MTKNSLNAQSSDGTLDNVGLMLRSISRVGVPNAQKQSELAIRVKEGSIEAKNEMLVGNLRLAVHWAQKFTGRGVDFPDLIQEAILGLNHAIDKFEPSLGFKFSTYASAWVRNYLQRAVYYQGRSITIPIQAAVDHTSFDRAYDEFVTENLRPPSIEEMSSATGFSLAKCRLLEAIPDQPLSLSTSIGDGPREIGDLVPEASSGPEEKLINDFDSAILQRAIAHLEDGEVDLISLRFGLKGLAPESRLNVAEKLGISVAEARQREGLILEKIRDSVGQELLDSNLTGRD